MSEILRIVELNQAGEPVDLLNLNDEEEFFLKRETFKIVAGVKQQIIAADARRWGGGRQVGETTENALVTWTAGVAGTTEQKCLEALESLLARLEANPYTMYVEWQAPGASEPTLYEMRGTAKWQTEYEWAQFAGAQLLVVTVEIPVAPLAQGLPVKVYEGSGLTLPEVISLSGVPGDAPAQAQVTIQVGGLELNPTFISGTFADSIAVDSEHIYWTLPGTHYIGRAKLNGTSVEPTWLHAEGKPRGVAVNSEHIFWTDSEFGVIGRATITGGSIEHSFISGAGALPWGIKVNSEHIYWANSAGIGGNSIGRATLAGGSVEGSFITGLSEPLGLALNSEHIYWCNNATNFIGRATLAGGSVEQKFIPAFAPRGVTVSSTHIYWTNRATNSIGRAPLSGVEPNQYYISTQTELQGIIEVGEHLYWATEQLGDIARASVAAGTAEAPIWALLGWASKPTTGLATAPFGLLDSVEGEGSGGWGLGILTGGRGGKAIWGVTDAGSAIWSVDPATLVPDSFQGELAVEVWARVLTNDILSSATLTLSALPQDGLSYGSPRYTDEWGSAGRPLTLPESGEAWRMTRLGTLHLLVNPLAPRVWELVLEGESAEAAKWGIDYLLVVPSTQRACSPTGKPFNSSFPFFISTGGAASKTILPNLTGLISTIPVTLTGKTSTTSEEITSLSSTLGLIPGMKVEGAGVAPGTVVTEVKPTAVKINKKGAKSETGTLTFVKNGHPDHGLGGQLLAIPPGEADLLVKLSNTIPDAPEVTDFTDQLSYEATVAVTVTPRWFLARTV